MIENIIVKNKQIDELIDANLFPEAADLLFNLQFNQWQQMQNNYTALKNVEEKSFWFDGFKFKVQFNPKRIKSTSANVRDETINNRPCFLCLENLPTEQKGILLNNDYILLCNPYPIFQKHFTVSNLKHIPQIIEKSIRDFLEITKKLSNKYTFIYNGPECGASAPDHLHFQALTKSLMPVENDIHQLKNDFGKTILTEGQNFITSIRDGMRTMIFVETPELQTAVKLFETFYKYYQKYIKSSNEPLMNMICKYDEEFGFSLIIFLRSKHRPESYFVRGTENLMISPAAVDLGGVLISPREEDFSKLDKSLIQKVISEVSLNGASFNELTSDLQKEFN